MTSVLELAFDPAVETPDDASSAKILDAALSLAGDSGMRAVTMDAVAAKAGVGRMTVYRRFGSREELVQALSVRECRNVLAQLGAGIDLSLPVEERIANGFLAALRVAREHPLLARMARVEPATLLADLTANDGQIMGLMRDWLAVQIHSAQVAGEAPDNDARVTAELLTRIGLSYVLMPDTTLGFDDDERVLAFAREHLAPLVTRS